MEVSAATISAGTDKVWSLVKEWQNRLLEGKNTNVAVYIVLAVDLEGQTNVLGHWMEDGAEGANFWLTVGTDLQNRGVEDIIHCLG